MLYKSNKIEEFRIEIEIAASKVGEFYYLSPAAAVAGCCSPPARCTPAGRWRAVVLHPLVLNCCPPAKPPVAGAPRRQPPAKPHQPPDDPESPIADPSSSGPPPARRP
jgi:hypothetical protein